MRHGQGTRYNTDVHNAVSTIKKYNADQELDEAPYSLGQRAGDTLKGFVPGGMGRMAKGRKESGKMANELNKQWQSHLGKKGLKDQSAATVQDLSDFIERLAPGTNASAFYQKAGISAENPASVVPKKSQEAIILSLAQSMNAQVPGGGTTTTGTTGTTDAGSKAQSAVDFAKRATGAKAKTTGAPETGGTAGTAGTTGTTGTTGTPGTTGKPGTPGTTGKPGTPGADGKPGTPGADGKPGEPGADGTPEKPADPNTNRVLSTDPPEVQGPKGVAWKKGADGQWKKSVHPFTSADTTMAAELDKILAGGMKPNAKQAEIIDFVSNLKNAQKTELRKYIRNAMSSRAKKVGH